MLDVRQLKVVIIIFINKMTNNYVWNTDKENKYNLDSLSARPKANITTNNALRKKIDENLTLAEREKNNQETSEYSKLQNYKNDDYNFNQNATIKRDNARKRGFDMRVSNIENINQKIAGLLSMVKKDKPTEKEQTKELDRTVDFELKMRDRTPGHDPSEKMKNLNSKSNNASGKKYLKQQPKISRFGQPKVEDFERKKAVSVFQPEQTSQAEIQNIRQIRMNFYEQERKRRENDAERYTPTRKPKLDDSNWMDEPYKEKQQPKKFDLKIGKTREKSEYQKMDIQKMIEERKRQRFNYAENERDVSPAGAIQRRYQLKTTKDNKEGQIRYNKQKQSPIQAVKSQYGYTQNLMQDTPRQRISPSPVRGHSSRNSQLYNFSKLSLVQEQPLRQQRNAPSTRIIDEQLNRIKSKIVQSETNRKKIEKFKPNTELQTQNSKTHTWRIANSISSQVEFDSNLRGSRDAFCKLPGQSKWTQLENIALQKGLNMRGDQLKQLITIGADEHNPFVSQKSNISMQEFVTLLVASQKNWEHMVMKCASGRSLKNENFDVRDLDLSSKGYLALEDLVCFVNLYSNTFYRNRDLALVMKRLQMAEGESRRGGIEYTTFLQTFVS